MYHVKVNLRDGRTKTRLQYYLDLLHLPRNTLLTSYHTFHLTKLCVALLLAFYPFHSYFA